MGPQPPEDMETQVAIMKKSERVVQTVHLSRRTQRSQREQKVSPMAARQLQRQISLQFKRTAMLVW